MMDVYEMGLAVQDLQKEVAQLKAFYDELDKSLPADCKMIVNGKVVILSSLAYGRPREAGEPVPIPQGWPTIEPKMLAPIDLGLIPGTGPEPKHPFEPFEYSERS